MTDENTATEPNDRRPVSALKPLIKLLAEVKQQVLKGVAELHSRSGERGHTHLLLCVYLVHMNTLINSLQINLKNVCLRHILFGFYNIYYFRSRLITFTSLNDKN